jgi:hypothetical protein
LHHAALSPCKSSGSGWDIIEERSTPPRLTDLGHGARVGTESTPVFLSPERGIELGPRKHDHGSDNMMSSGSMRAKTKDSVCGLVQLSCSVSRHPAVKYEQQLRCRNTALSPYSLCSLLSFLPHAWFMIKVWLRWSISPDFLVNHEGNGCSGLPPHVLLRGK